METVRKNKTFLIDTLSTDASIVLQHVQSDDIILQRDYKNLNHPNYTDEKIIINLLDTVMGRGDETCRKFLKVLEKQELQEIFPQLKHHFTPEQASAERQREREKGSVMAHHKGAEFVDKHREQLIQRVSSVMEIADCLLTQKMITDEMYSEISAAATMQGKMRILYKSLDSKTVKEEFYKVLKEKQRFLVADLEG
ncbi:caspase-8-like, partial [Clarias magur]